VKRKTISGGEEIIDKYGFAQKEVLKNISKVHLADDDDGREVDELDDMVADGDDDDEYKGGYVDEMDEDESYKEDLMAR
jgi:hypothetical protein